MMLNLLSVCLFAKSFDGYVLYKVLNPSVELAEELNQSYDVWSTNKDYLEVFMPSTEFKSFDVQQYEIVNSEIPDLIQKESTRLKRRKRFKKPSPQEPSEVWFEEFFGDYSSYSEIKEWYFKLSQTYPDLVEFVPSIGKSNEGRDLFAIHLTAPTQESKKQFYFQSLIHAREWISGTTTAYITWKLINGFLENDSRIVNILNKSEFVIVPVVNPDGYEYTHSNNRMWRKNTRVISNRVAGVVIDTDLGFEQKLPRWSLGSGR
eukprot:NODE_572_length_6559_cov_0.536842.p4 type:complete len:262 gc:universal NODE_572_length_6559_cov_0.536842:373-1158(+)